MTQLSQITGSGKSRRPGANNGDTFASSRGNPGVLLPQSTVMLSGKALKHPDADSLVKQSATALSLTGMDANVTADRGEGYFLSDYGYCLGRLTLANKADIAGHINTSRTGVATGGTNQPLAHCCLAVMLLDMLLIFVTEIADGGKDRVRRCLP